MKFNFNALSFKLPAFLRQKYINLLVGFSFSVSLSLGCATKSQSRWLSMAIAAPIGASVGVATTPIDEKQEFHAFTWGAAFVAATAIFGNYYFNDNVDLEKLRTENRELKNQPKFHLITEGKGYFKTPFAKKGTKNIKWKVYKTDKWLTDGQNRKFHQDMMIERIEEPK